jgi:hypothetical protein
MTPSILDYIGDVGGLNDIVATVFGFFLLTYSNNRTYAILMNRLYHLSSTLEEGEKAINEIDKNPGMLSRGTK